MVDTKMGLQPTTRGELRQQRLKQRVRPRAGLRVTPKNDDIRKYIKHPKAGGFRSEGSVEWPNDAFTQRRIRDGDVTVEKEHENKRHERHAHREQRES